MFMDKKDFKKLRFYEIYPTSFYDSNGDGIGDLRGITMKLDYVKELGFNAIWFNPFFKSPFKDGGYDVSDFFDIDPRFGTLEDYKEMVKAAHEKGLAIIIDLVAGHASIDNKDFIKSAQQEKNEYSDLFIWNNSVWEKDGGVYQMISGMFQRDACYMVNFFAHQPAFNYGFNKIEKPWQISYKDKRCEITRNYLLKIMRFWLDLGTDGFRVDMAESLVKNDWECGHLATIELWNYFFDIIKKEYPDSFFVAEWSNPSKAFKANFDCDFVLNFASNYYHKMFRGDEKAGEIAIINSGNDIQNAVEDLKRRVDESIKFNKYLGNISGNHDTPRIADYLEGEKLRLFYMFEYFLPGIPFVLYGDELEMKTGHVKFKDGGYYRTGTRIPMIWDNVGKNHGFSTTTGETYLPFDERNKISVESALNDETSLYYFIKKLNAIKEKNEELNELDTKIELEGRVLKIKRGNRFELIVNYSDCDYAIKGKTIIASCYIKNSILRPYNAVLLEN